MSIQKTDEFEKTDFLEKVQYSLGLSNQLPDPRRGVSPSFVHGKLVQVSFSEQSLLQIRDLVLSEKRTDRSLGDIKIILLVKDTALRFYWILLPHYDEIVSWPKQQTQSLVEKCILRSFTRSGFKIQLGHFSRDPMTEKKLITSAMIVISELFALLPEYSYEDLIQWN